MFREAGDFVRILYKLLRIYGYICFRYVAILKIVHVRVPKMNSLYRNLFSAASYHVHAIY